MLFLFFPFKANPTITKTLVMQQSFFKIVTRNRDFNIILQVFFPNKGCQEQELSPNIYLGLRLGVRPNKRCREFALFKRPDYR